MEPDRPRINGDGVELFLYGKVYPLQGVDPKAVTLDAQRAIVESNLTKALHLLGWTVIDAIVKDPATDVKFNGVQSVPHRDNYPDRFCALWASENPTIIIFENSQQIQPEPYQLVVIDDSRLLHCKPQPAIIKGRWFARLSVKKRSM